MQIFCIGLRALLCGIGPTNFGAERPPHRAASVLVRIVSVVGVSGYGEEPTCLRIEDLGEVEVPRVGVMRAAIMYPADEVEFPAIRPGLDLVREVRHRRPVEARDDVAAGREGAGRLFADRIVVADEVARLHLPGAVLREADGQAGLAPIDLNIARDDAKVGLPVVEHVNRAAEHFPGFEELVAFMLYGGEAQANVRPAREGKLLLHRVELALHHTQLLVGNTALLKGIVCEEVGKDCHSYGGKSGEQPVIGLKTIKETSPRKGNDFLECLLGVREGCCLCRHISVLVGGESLDYITPDVRGSCRSRLESTSANVLAIDLR
jgi:hypothetical protein